jgi:hypothetical protein
MLREVFEQGIKFLVRQMAKSPDGSDEPQITQKSLQTTRKMKVRPEVH